VRQHSRNPTSQREHDDTPNIDSAYINTDATHYTVVNRPQHDCILSITSWLPPHGGHVPAIRATTPTSARFPFRFPEKNRNAPEMEPKFPTWVYGESLWFCRVLPQTSSVYGSHNHNHNYTLMVMATLTGARHCFRYNHQKSGEVILWQSNFMVMVMVMLMADRCGRSNYKLYFNQTPFSLNKTENFVSIYEVCRSL
jgi:hypothetical protein